MRARACYLHCVMAAFSFSCVWCMCLCLVIGVTAPVTIDVCKGRDHICVNETVFQTCIYDSTSKTTVPYGNPKLCDDGEICGNDILQCIAAPPFQCQAAGIFKHTIGCEWYHVCTLYPNQIVDTKIRCPQGLLFSSNQTRCVEPHLSDCKTC